MTLFTPLLIGFTVILAAAAIGVTASLPREKRGAAVYAQLLIMAGVYLGFAIAALEPIDQAGRSAYSAVLIEAFTAFALAGAGLAALYSSRIWLLGALILVHGGIDLLHLLLRASYSPDWYEFLCVLYDAIVGVAAIWLLSETPRQN